MIVAARAMADTKVSGQLSHRVATLLRFFKRPKVISILLRLLQRLLSYLTDVLRDFRPGTHALIFLSSDALCSQSASRPRSAKSQPAWGRLFMSVAAPVQSLACPADMKGRIGRYLVHP